MSRYLYSQCVIPRFLVFHFVLLVALGMASVARSVSWPLLFRLKYVNRYWMKSHILHRHVLSPKDQSLHLSSEMWQHFVWMFMVPRWWIASGMPWCFLRRHDEFDICGFEWNVSAAIGLNSSRRMTFPSASALLWLNPKVHSQNIPTWAFLDYIFIWYT